MTKETLKEAKNLEIGINNTKSNIDKCNRINPNTTSYISNNSNNILLSPDIRDKVIILVKEELEKKQKALEKKLEGL